MVRDPSIVSPSLTGVFIGGGHNKQVQDRGARCRGSVVPPLPDGDGGVTDRATRGACSAGSGIVSCTTSLGLRPQSQHPVTVSDSCGIEPLRGGQAHHSLRVAPLPTCARGGAVMCAVSPVWPGQGSGGREGRRGGRGRGSASAEVSRRAVDIATSRRTIKVHTQRA